MSLTIRQSTYDSTIMEIQYPSHDTTRYIFLYSENQDSMRCLRLNKLSRSLLIM